MTSVTARIFSSAAAAAAAVAGFAATCAALASLSGRGATLPVRRPVALHSASKASSLVSCARRTRRTLGRAGALLARRIPTRRYSNHNTEKKDLGSRGVFFSCCSMKRLKVCPLFLASRVHSSGRTRRVTVHQQGQALTMPVPVPRNARCELLVRAAQTMPGALRHM